MTIVINREIVTQVDHDSGSLRSLATVVHKFSEIGEYHGEVHQGKQGVVGNFTIVVSGKSSARATENVSKPTVAEVNLSQIQSGTNGKKTTANGNCFQLEEEGYAVFYAPSGTLGAYAVEVFKSGERGRGAKVFDSRSLTKEDTLSVILLRPGTYSLVNSLLDSDSKKKAKLVVAYPDARVRNLEPVKIRCSSDGFSPNTINITPMQGLVFDFDVRSRVVVELVKPDDGSGKPLFPSRMKRSSTKVRVVNRRFQSSRILG